MLLFVPPYFNNYTFNVAYPLKFRYTAYTTSCSVDDVVASLANGDINNDQRYDSALARKQCRNFHYITVAWILVTRVKGATD